MICAICPNYYDCELRMWHSDLPPTTQYLSAQIFHEFCQRYGTKGVEI